VFQLQKTSNYGSSTPAVARTVLQGRPIVEFFNATAEQKSAAMELLMELQRHLLKCVETRDSLEAEIEAGRAEFVARPQSRDPTGPVMSLPGVGDLQSKAEQFLQSSKLAIATAGNLVEPFFGAGFGHKFHKLADWATEKFGSNDDFAKRVEAAKPFVARVVKMRNAVDHPKSEPGAPLIVANFTLQETNGALSLVEPGWSLTGEPMQPLLVSFNLIIESIICLCEAMLIELFYKLRSSDILVIEEIPIERRDPANPMALRVTIAIAPTS